MWTTEQCVRLAIEEKLLKNYMSHFHILSRRTETHIQGWAHTNSGRRYEARIDLPASFPYGMPELYVVQPKTLPQHDATKTVNSVGPSHRFHTRHNGHDGCIQICHSANWDASTTCIQVLVKLHCWLEAYEGHLRTGQDLAAFLL